VDWIGRFLAWLFGRSEGRSEQRQADQNATNAAKDRVAHAIQKAPHDAAETDQRVDDRGV
jgi:hypothetical protein